MPKATIKMANKNNLYLYSTEVENLFINEFLPSAPGDFVKVYIFTKMYAQYNLNLTYSEMTRLMGISREEIDKAWEYWAATGLVNIIRREDNSIEEIEFFSLIEKMYGTKIDQTGKVTASSAEVSIPAKDDEEAGSVPDENDVYSQDDEDRFAQVINQSITDLYIQYGVYAGNVGRTVSKRDMTILSDAIKVYRITPDVMSYAIKYCAEEINKVSAPYMFTVARRWAENGCTTIDQCRNLIDQFSRKNDYYRAVFRQVGFTRDPGPGDRDLMDKWIEGMGFTIAEVLEACKKTIGKRDPNLNYVDKVLENWLKEKGGIDPKIDSVKKLEQNAAGNQIKDAGGSEGGGAIQPKSKQKSQLAVSKQVLSDYYDYMRSESIATQKARIAELCKTIPELRELYSQEENLKNALLAGGSKEKRQAIRRQKSQLDEEKSRLLRENGYSPDYLNRKFRCMVCKDTGLTDDGRICTCREARVEEAYRWNQKRNQK